MSTNDTDIEDARPYLCYPFGVAETLKQHHGIHSLTQIIEERSETFHEPVIGMPKQDQGVWTCEMYTYKNILDGVNALCLHFLENGILPQRTKADAAQEMTVALVAPSNVDMMMCMLAMQRLGLGVLLITPNQTARVIKHLCKELEVLRVVSPLSIDGLETTPLPPSSIWLTAIAKPGKTYTRALSPEEEGHTTGVVYHTSGTTSGLPKPLPTKHRFLVSFCAHKYTQLATLTTTPLNTGGTADVCRSMCANAMLFLFPDSSPLTARNVCEARDACSKALGREVRALSCVPYVAKMLVENEEALAMLQRLEFLGVGGAPLPKATGDFIVHAGIPLVSRMGSSECNFLMSSYRDYKSDKDWDYLRSEPGGHHFKFLPQTDGTGNYELEVRGTWPALAVATNHSGNFRTGDLFQPHPTTPHAWLYLGRNDDTIVLGNGKKADPKALEGTLRGLKYLNNALVYGTGRNNIGILIIESEDETAPKGAQLRERVWQEVVEGINKQSPAHAEVYQEMILILPATKDFEKTPKGTVFRNGTYAKFEEEIAAAYTQTREKVSVDDAELGDYVSSVVTRISGKPLRPDDDLFGAGVNSLQSVRIRNVLAGELDLELPSNIVFEEPSINRIISYVKRLRSGESALAEDVSGLMHKLASKYRHQESARDGDLRQKRLTNDTSPTPVPQIVLLTGVTGGLGSHLLQQMMFETSTKIEKVYCLIRTGGDESVDARMQKTLEYREITLPETDVEVVYLPTDLSKADLGLDKRVADEIRRGVTLIIHAAWPVNFNASLSSFEASIASTVNLLEFAIASRQACRFYFCSSTASIINHKTTPIPEIPTGETGDASKIGYAQSKWVTEQVVSSYASVVDVGIFRIGQLCGDSLHGVWSESEGWSLMFAATNVISAMPRLVEDNVAWLPVDVAAKAILEIVRDRHGSGEVWHIVNPGKGTSWENVLEYFKMSGWDFDVVRPREWVNRLERSRERDNPSRKLLGLWKDAFVERDDGDEDVERDRPLSSDPVFDTTRAVGASPALKHAKPVNQALMRKIFKNWQTRGFLR